MDAKDAKWTAIALIRDWAEACIRPIYPVVPEEEYTNMATEILKVTKKRQSVQEMGFAIRLVLSKTKDDYRRNAVSAQANLLRHIGEVANLMCSSDFVKIFSSSHYPFERGEPRHAQG